MLPLATNEPLMICEPYPVLAVELIVMLPPDVGAVVLLPATMPPPSI